MNINEKPNCNISIGFLISLIFDFPRVVECLAKFLHSGFYSLNHSLRESFAAHRYNLKDTRPKTYEYFPVCITNNFFFTRCFSLIKDKMIISIS